MSYSNKKPIIDDNMFLNKNSPTFQIIYEKHSQYVVLKFILDETDKTAIRNFSSHKFPS